MDKTKSKAKPTKKKKNTKKIISIILIVGPFVGIVVTMASYAVLGALFAGAAPASQDMVVMGSIIRLALGFLGLVSVVGIIIGGPIGVILMFQDK